MKIFLLAIALFLGTSMFSPLSAEAEDVWAMTAANGDMAYVMTETVYNDGDNFGCKAKSLYSQGGGRASKTWHIETYYFGLDDSGNWYCYRNGKLTDLTGGDRAIFNTAMKYRP